MQRGSNRPSWRSLRQIGLATFAMAGVVVAATGCGSSSKNSSSSGGGSPIVIGVESAVETPTINFGGDVAGVFAAADTINKQGGINGRKIKVEFCNTQNQANQELACIRKIQSAGAVALVGQQYNNAGGAVQAYEQAHHLADIEYTGALPNGYAGTNTFPVTWELASWMPCMTNQLAQRAGGKRVVAIAQAGNPVVNTILGWFKTYAVGQGLTWLPPIIAPMNTADFAPYVSKVAQSRANILVNVAFNSQAVMRALSAAGSPVTTCTALGFTQAGGWTGLGSSNQKLYIGATFRAFDDNKNAPLMSTFLKSMADYKASGKKLAKYADTSPNNFQAQAMGAWLGTWGFAQVARKIKGPITAESVEAAMSKSTLKMGGIIPDVNFAQKPKSGGPFQRVWNSDAYLWKYNPADNTYRQVGVVPDTLPATFR